MDAVLDPGESLGALCILATNPACVVTRSVSGSENDPWESGTCPVAFVEFWLRPVAVAATNAATSVDIDGAKMGFTVDGGLGRAFVYDSDGVGGGESVPLDFVFPVDGSGAASNWVHVAVRRDYSNGWYDAWLDGILYVVGAGSDTSPQPGAPSLLRFDGDVSAPVQLDLLALSPDNPLFADADRDGMPDEFEESRALNPAADDRDGDVDWDGFANIAEYAAGTAPDDFASSPGASNALFYVDGILGDDGFNGLASHPSAAGGPKRTVDAGLGLATASTLPSPIVVIRESTNAYLEQTVAPGTNAIVFRPTGNVKIQP